MSGIDFDPWGKEAQPVQPVQPDRPVQGEPPADSVLEEVRDWLERYVTVVEDSDLDVLTLWAVHTHLCVETYSTPRLTIDSPLPGSGKTTVLDHLSRLCLDPVQAASLGSAALLTRMLEAAEPSTRTILIDEVDRSLRPDNPATPDLLAILNSGYRRGASRPVLVPANGGKWEVAEMPTFAPVAMAGNDPKLPDDTKSRAIRVLLFPDVDGTAEESDWELIADDAERLHSKVAAWADRVRESVRRNRPTLPEGIRGRDRERWAPLKRVADAAGGRWPDVVDQLARADVARIRGEREEGITVQKPHIVLLEHVHAEFLNEKFIATRDLVGSLVADHPATWGVESSYGKALTEQRLGRMLSTHYKVTSSRPDSNGPRGYTRASLAPAFRSMGLEAGHPPVEPVYLAEPAEPAGSRTCEFCGHGAKAGSNICAECEAA